MDSAALAVVQEVERMDEEGEKGGLLVFLPGKEEIEACRQLLLHSLLPPSTPHQVLPLHASLSPQDQLRVFEEGEGGGRKVILSTNIAETSLTIPNIKVVIDTGVSRQKKVNEVTGLESLTVLPISQAQANQRCGRAGRVGDGKCFRLFTEMSFQSLPLHSLPEMSRIGLDEVVLQLVALGVGDILGFDFLTPPSPLLIIRSVKRLVMMGAIEWKLLRTNEEEKEEEEEENQQHKHLSLTPHGKELSCLPLPPILSNWLLASTSVSMSCFCQTLISVSLLSSSDNLFLYPSTEAKRNAAEACRLAFKSPSGDHLSAINAYHSWLEAGRDREWTYAHFLNGRALFSTSKIACQLIDQTCQILSNREVAPLLPPADIRELKGRIEKGRVLMDELKDEDVVEEVEGEFLRGMVKGLSPHIATLSPQSNSYRSFLLKADDLHIHPSSSIHGESPKPPVVIFSEVVESSRRYMRMVTSIQSALLPEILPSRFSVTTQITNSTVT